jgi:Probable lipoprotein LpqN
MARRLKPTIAVMVAILALTSGCTKQIEGSAQSAPGTNTPSSTGARSSSSTPSRSPSSSAVTLTTPNDAGGPEVTVTPPDGWVKTAGSSPSANTALVATFLAQDSRANGFTPVTTVVISALPGVQSMDEALTVDKNSAARSLTGYHEISARFLTVSGNPGQRLLGTWVSTSLPTPLTIAVTSVAVRKGTQIYLVDLVSQTTKGDDTTWQQAVREFHDSLSIA